MPTWRRFARKVFQCGLYEAQDVLAESADVDLIALDEDWGFRAKERWLRRAVYHGVSSATALNPGLISVPLKRDYDAFIAVCQTYEDLLYVNAIDGWPDRCRTSVCWIDEVWLASIDDRRPWLKALEKFDHIFVGISGSVAALSATLGRQCHWLPGAVDAMRFSPCHAPQRRAIDVLSVGRRYDGIHAALLELASQSRLFYVHDTFRASVADAFDHAEHRNQLANLARRSRYFLVAPAKMDFHWETQGQVEVGHRYFEGAMAGCVLLGPAQDCESFRRLFDWPNAVVPIAADGSDTAETLRRLQGQPDGRDEIGGRNAVETLRRHDWIHRWKQMFQIAGIAVDPEMDARDARLRELADNAGSALVPAPLRRLS